MKPSESFLKGYHRQTNRIKRQETNEPANTNMKNQINSGKMKQILDEMRFQPSYIRLMGSEGQFHTEYLTISVNGERIRLQSVDTQAGVNIASPVPPVGAAASHSVPYYFPGRGHYFRGANTLQGFPFIGDRMRIEFSFKPMATDMLLFALGNHVPS